MDSLNDNGKRPHEDVADRRPVRFVVSNLEHLVELRNSLSHEDMVEFRSKFGNIDHVIDLKADWNAVAAMAKYFDPKLRCFSTRNLDLAPTLEEYRHMLSLNTSAYISKLYVPDLSKPSKPQKDRVTIYQSCMAETFGISTEWGKDIYAREGRQNNVILWNRAYSDMKRNVVCLQQSNHRLNFLALGIFGLVLFPTIANGVHEQVLDMVLRVIEDPDIDIVPAILAETYSALLMWKKNKPYMRCCVPLLSMWIHSHFPEGSKPEYKSVMFGGPSHIEQFIKHKKKVMEMEAWYQMLHKATNEEVLWCASWMDTNYYLGPPTDDNYRNRDWIPLIGVFNAVSYSPNMVVRHFNDEQDVPSFIRVDEYHVRYNGDAKAKIAEDLDTMHRRWNQCKEVEVKKVNGRKIGGAKNRYLTWREGWGKNKTYPSKARPSIYMELIRLKKMVGEAKQEIYRTNQKWSKKLHKDNIDQYFGHHDTRMLGRAAIDLKIMRKENNWGNKLFQVWDELVSKVPTDCTSKLKQIKNSMLIQIDMLKEVKAEQEKQIGELIEALEQAEARAIDWEKKAISWEKKAVGLGSELASMKDELSQAKEEARSVEEEKRSAEERAERAMKENLSLKAQLEQLVAGFEKHGKNMEQEVTEEESENVIADLYLEADQVQAM